MVYKTKLSAKEIKSRLKEVTMPHHKMITIFDAEYSHFLVYCKKKTFIIESMYPLNKRNNLLRRLLPVCVKGKIQERKDGSIVEISRSSAMSWKDVLWFCVLTSIILGFCYSRDIMDLPSALFCLVLSLIFTWSILNGFALLFENAKERQYEAEKFLERVLEMEKADA